MCLLLFYYFTLKASAFSVSINLSTRCQSAKKKVIFCQFEFVGVQRYGRVQIDKKQAMERNPRWIPLRLTCVLFTGCFTSFSMTKNANVVSAREKYFKKTFHEKGTTDRKKCRTRSTANKKVLL